MGIKTKQHTICFRDNPDQNYNIIIDQDLLPRLLGYVKDMVSLKKQVIITDSNVVKAGHLNRLDPETKTPVYVINSDDQGGVESRKTAATAADIIDFLDENRFEKNDTLICLGGGVIGDIGGFVAGTYKRGETGMTYIQVPTTTLSQADSSVGGKCAVDGKFSKNVQRCIYQPHFVAIDVDSLLTLDDRNFRSGLVESVKAGLILDMEYFKFLAKNMEGILQKDDNLLEEVAYNSVRLKGEIVGKDPNEKNERRVLNFGHTIGHSIEIASGFKLYHGEAVSLGLLAALHISTSINGMSGSDLEWARYVLIEKLGMPRSVPSYVSREKVEEGLARDKKVVNGVPQFVTIDTIGKFHTDNGQYAMPIPKKALDEALDYIF